MKVIEKNESLVKKLIRKINIPPNLSKEEVTLVDFIRNNRDLYTSHQVSEYFSLFNEWDYDMTEDMIKKLIGKRVLKISSQRISLVDRKRLRIRTEPA